MVLETSLELRVLWLVVVPETVLLVGPELDPVEVICDIVLLRPDLVDLERVLVETEEELLITPEVALDFVVLVTPDVALDLVVLVTMLELLLEVHPYQPLDAEAVWLVAAGDHAAQP